MDRRTLEDEDVENGIKSDNLVWTGIVIGAVVTVAALISFAFKYLLSKYVKR